ncbi:MAG: molybdopterin converting factor subunit 1 [Pseudomonadota bacterium]
MPRDDIHILYFAWVREITGVDGERLVLPVSGLTGAALLTHLTEKYPGLKARADRLLIAINQTQSDPETPLKPGDEVALFPPVTGG